MSLRRPAAALRNGAADGPPGRYEIPVIAWCAYCQHFIGEAPPLDDYGVTHGLCSSCDRAGVFADDGAAARIAPLAALYRELFRTAAAGKLHEAEGLLARSRNLGIEPLEALIGLVQPALYSVGKEWARKKLTIAEEHRFTAFCTRVVELVDELTPPASEERPALLVAVEGNNHWLGLRFVELWLRRHGIAAHVVYPGLPTEEIVELTARLRPRFLGLSVALHTQLDAVRAIALQVDVPVLCGGAAIRMCRPADLPGVKFVTTVTELAGRPELASGPEPSALRD